MKQQLEAEVDARDARGRQRKRDPKTVKSVVQDWRLEVRASGSKTLQS
uniref:Uncharacterized protein n=1 Tax=Peronospora matthiolae TaxID=2874970 RepID=A0AAV1VIQ4_9STRA